MFVDSIFGAYETIFSQPMMETAARMAATDMARELAFSSSDGASAGGAGAAGAGAGAGVSSSSGSSSGSGSGFGGHSKSTRSP